MGDILLISGRPGTGKTTLIRRLADALGNRAGGFYTQEIRESGSRMGFRLATLRGPSAVFAHVEWAARIPHRVGRYGVDVSVLDRIGLKSVRQASRRRQVILVDEIGKMELLSAAFRTVLDEAASGPAPLVATIISAPHPWAKAFKKRPHVTLYEMTRVNRDRLLKAALAWLCERGIQGTVNDE